MIRLAPIGDLCLAESEWPHLGLMVMVAVNMESLDDLGVAKLTVSDAFSRGRQSVF